MTDVISAAGLDRINRVRSVCAQALAAVLRDGQGCCERELADRWLAQMSSHDEILPQGWYQPPPHGVSVLIGNRPPFDRLTYTSLRLPQTWPRRDVFLTDDSVVYAYASAVDRRSGLIGDLGITLYRGSDAGMRQNIAACLQVVADAAQFAQVGMPLRELYDYIAGRIADLGCAHRGVSLFTDPTGSNFGYTIPWSNTEPSDEVRGFLDAGDMPSISTSINTGRIFINAKETQPIQPTMALAIEPVTTTGDRPPVSFHVIVTFTAGRKHVVSHFRPLFELFAMTEYQAGDTLTALDCN